MDSNKKAQVSMEYLVVIGFVTLIITVILGIALFYSSSIRDRIRDTQISDCAGKIVSSAESVFYSGSPSKSTVSCYLPENVKVIEILENSLVFSVQTSSGVSRTAFSSKVPIAGNLSVFSGTRKVQMNAQEDYVFISLI